ncbi:TetR/AcrR family transcriptional regulator [Streptomyces sp. CA-111067]|uniref:TetR/AcrR family transcriptional regulator n=1 Tax=Streptomyces sp. CA-111067 TaxID=3240046 RepID=UPI003D97AEF7
MPRPKGDHESRRREVSEAVWRVMSAGGFTGLTMRAVAGELGSSTGLLTHYFASKHALVKYALDLLEQRTAARPRREAGGGLDGLRAALLDILPLDADAVAGNRIWVSSWDSALADPELTCDHARRYAHSRGVLAARVAAAQDAGDLPPGDPDRVAASAQSFALGLVVQALLDPAAFPPERQIELLDDYLTALTRGPAGAGPSQPSAKPG